MSSAYLEPPPLAIAHRGGAAHGDENTAEAFARAIGLGYRYLETDVHSTRDGVAVVLHDPALDRMTGVKASVSELSYAALACVRVAGGSVVPRLDEVLGSWPGVKFNIDIKAGGAVEPTVAAVRDTGAQRRVLLASFSDTRLRRARALTGEQVATSLAQREVARLWLAAKLGRRISLSPSVVAAQIPRSIAKARFIRHAQRHGLQVHVWTVDDPAEMAGLLDLGVDGIMTDRIDVLRRVFEDRGHWRSGP